MLHLFTIHQGLRTPMSNILANWADQQKHLMVQVLSWLKIIPCKTSIHSDNHSDDIYLWEIKVVWMRWYFARFHEIINQKDAENFSQDCILLNYLSVISSQSIQNFSQKCQYFTLIDQSVSLITVASLVYLGRNQLWFQFSTLTNKKVLFLNTILSVRCTKDSSFFSQQIVPWHPNFSNQSCFFLSRNIRKWRSFK